MEEKRSEERFVGPGSQETASVMEIWLQGGMLLATMVKEWEEQDWGEVEGELSA